MVRRHRIPNATFPKNARRARALWGELSRNNLDQLRDLTIRHELSVAAGDLYMLDGKWYVTHAGLLRIAERARCCGIKTVLQKSFSEPATSRWVFKATVYNSAKSRGFVGYGDADPTNISPLVRGAELRVAETRAVNRALRKAYGIGLCSVEELGWEPRVHNPSDPPKATPTANPNGHQAIHTSLRDRLCLLIRRYQLDANLVKAYAADSCGTRNLRDATRGQIETFIANLSDWAAKDRQALLCKLNSYSTSQEVTS